MTDGIRVYVIDETYGQDGDDWEQQSAAFKKKIEAEHQRPFEYEDIGRGASQPAFFVTLIELLPYPGAIALFFTGKKINENIEAWGKLYERLKNFLNRNPALDKQGVRTCGQSHP